MMASVRKFNLKRVLIILLIVIFAFCATSMVATKIIYDSIFVRYDGAPVQVPQQLQTMVEPYGTVRSTLCSSKQIGDTLEVTLTAECVEEIGKTVPILTEELGEAP